MKEWDNARSLWTRTTEGMLQSEVNGKPFLESSPTPFLIRSCNLKEQSAAGKGNRKHKDLITTLKPSQLQLLFSSTDLILRQ